MRIAQVLYSVAIVLCSINVGHSIPQLINYQGELTSGGTPVTLPTNVQFRLWDMAAGGTQQWTETQLVTPGSDGRFSVLLGSVNPIPDAALDQPNAYLGLTISPDPEMTPRTRLVAVAYAYRPGTIDGATGGAITGDISVNGKATIGSGNTNSGTHSLVVGKDNTATNSYTSVAGGQGNRVTGGWGTTGGGFYNVISGQFATVGGGASDTAGHDYATVGGGDRNVASDIATTVAGGQFNKARASGAAIGGGIGNVILPVAYRATISGGLNNQASGPSSTVSGGQNNIASGFAATIGGGSDNNAAGRYSYASGFRAKSNHDGVFVWADSSDADFASTAADQFLVRANGGVGIGTDSPSAQLEVATGQKRAAEFSNSYSSAGVGVLAATVTVKNTSPSGIGTYTEANTSDAAAVITNTSTGITLKCLGSGFTNDFVVRADGDVGVGTATPNFTLDVRGTIGNNATLYHSDRRWKRDVRPLESSLEKVLKLNGVSYEWKGDEFADMNFPEGRQIGLIAQDVERVISEVVQTADDGFKSVEYAKLVAVLIEAVKEQQAQIEELREMIQTQANIQR